MSEQKQCRAINQSEQQAMLRKPPLTTSVTLNIHPLHLPMHEIRLQQYQCLAFRRLIDYLDKNILPMETCLAKHIVAVAGQL